MKKSENIGMIRPYSDKLVILARLIDAVVIGLTLWSILAINFVEWDGKLTWWLLIAIVIFGIFAEFTELYRQDRGLSVFTEIKSILISWAFVMIVIISINQGYSLIDPIYKQCFWLWAGAVPLELVSWHFILMSVTSTFRKLGRNSRRVAIVGATKLGGELERIFSEEASLGLKFVGYFDDRNPIKSENDSADDFREKRKVSTDRSLLNSVTLAGNLQQLVSRAKQGTIDIVYITLALSAEHRIKQLVQQLSDSTVSVYYVPDLFVFDLLRSNLHHIKGIPIVSIHDTPFYGVDGAVKRVFDILFSLMILSVIAIPMLLIAVAVKLASPGPVLFKQRRYGIGGEPIVVWKFRSMTVCEDGEDIAQAKKNDPRTTRLGAFLRRTSLDELPQFINVLQGKMSIVGPRPHAVTHNELYRGKIQGYMLRHKVKPGITGYAQVNGFRGETDTLDKMEGRIQYDLAYIRNWSLWLDIKIILLTLLKGFMSPKAY